MLALTALRSQVIGDMAGGHGVAWWTGLDEPRRLLVGDYLVGLTDSAGTNLSQAVMHLSRFTELRDALDFEMRRNIRAAMARGSVFGPTSESFDNRDVEADGHFTGYFRALGSVLDNLGGIAVGALGMPTSIVKASWSDIGGWASTAKRATTKHGLSTEHRDLIDDATGRFSSVLIGAPTDWIEWTLDYRNSLVHRASRLWINVVDNKARSGIAHPVPRHPAQTQAESFAMSRSITEDVLRRETLDTLNLLLDQVLHLVPLSGEICINVWAQRRQNPALHLQPIAQWPVLQQGRRLRFDGAGRQASLTSGSFLAINPTLGERLRAARLMDEDRGQWQSWMRRGGGD